MPSKPLTFNTDTPDPDRESIRFPSVIPPPSRNSSLVPGPLRRRGNPLWLPRGAGPLILRSLEGRAEVARTPSIVHIRLPTPDNPCHPEAPRGISSAHPPDNTLHLNHGMDLPSPIPPC